ncbi:RNA polymerase sigma factor [Jiulongibacter sediminis]|uniref:RNA polymerase sigma factor n=1 Tax=Jiulongibacter sediminis TaxID=1605367 RepID=UPI0026F18B93|nr:sigma-70 family RNA polymerase sigma factor [Jiulongibacter sediminis]
MEEKQLLKLLKTKDEEGFQILYRNYSDVIYGIIIRMLKDPDESADMLQEVFVRIWTKMDSYDSKKGRLFTWMANLTRNFVIDRIRSADYKNHNLNYFVRDDNVGSVDRKFNTEQNINTIGLKGQVNELKENQRVLIQKIYFEGYTQVDLAEELDIPLGTLKTRVRAAMKELRKNFKEE